MERRRFKFLQIRVHEPLGRPECPYAYRWVVNLGAFSLRLHQWLRSDDKRYLHDHPFWFWTLILKGSYTDVTGIKNEILKTGALRYRSASHAHYVKVERPNTWSLLFCGPPIHQWGFWVDGRRKRPLKYFHQFGHPPCEEL